MASFGISSGTGEAVGEGFSEANETGLVIISQARSGIFDTSDRYTTLVGVGRVSPAGTTGRVRVSIMNP